MDIVPLLPLDIWQQIIPQIGAESLLALRTVSKSFLKLLSRVETDWKFSFSPPEKRVQKHTCVLRTFCVGDLKVEEAIDPKAS